MRSLLFCALLAGCATAPPTNETPPPEDTPPVETFDAAGTLATFLSGEFDSLQQSIDDPQYFAIQLITCAVEAPELGDTVLYIEQSVMDTPTQPYRQRLYVVTGDDDPNLAHTEVFALTNPGAAIGLCEGDLATFTEADVTLREGCGVHMTWDEDSEAFEGGTEGEDCASSLGDAVHATSEVTASVDVLESWDRGWNANGDQSWGATAGPYRFLRRESATGDDDDAADDDDASDDDDATPSEDMDAFYDDVSDAICGALSRCCNDGDRASFFEPWAANTLLAPYADQMPPSDASCSALVRDSLEITPFGDWVRATDEGLVDFNPGAHQACLDALNTAQCGEGVRAALYDGTCYSFQAPEGGDAQRSMFERTGDDGDACIPIADGIGSSYYGTCDPTSAFCCYDGTCGPPFDTNGDPYDGVCRPSSAVGEACSAVEPVQLCSTGLSCNWDSGLCEASADAVLTLGDSCADSSWNLLGECDDSWCDLFGDRTCQPLKDDGEVCTAGWECDSGACEGTCTPNDHCSGS